MLVAVIAARFMFQTFPQARSPLAQAGTHTHARIHRIRFKAARNPNRAHGGTHIVLIRTEHVSTRSHRISKTLFPIFPHYSLSARSHSHTCRTHSCETGSAGMCTHRFAHTLNRTQTFGCTFPCMHTIFRALGLGRVVTPMLLPLFLPFAARVN